MSSVGEVAGAALRSLLDLFAPPVCPLCAEPIEEGGDGLCADCDSGVRTLSPPFCPICALPFAGVGSSHPCSLCVKKPPPFVEAKVHGLFEGKLREAILRFKYGQNMALRSTLEGMILKVCREGWPQGGGFSTVVPVPCHSQVLRRRGFDLPALLARSVAKEWGIEWRPFALRKLDSRVRMAGLDLKARRLAAAGLYAVSERVSGRVLLVDDVVTSTVTARAAARCLRRGGASEVAVAALARTGLSPRGRL